LNYRGDHSFLEGDYAVTRKKHLFMTVVLVALSLAVTGVSAAPAPKPDNLSKAILSYFSELEGTPAPAWLTPGMRVVYEITSEDMKDPSKNQSGYLVYDVVDVNGDCVVNMMSSSEKLSEQPLGLMYVSGLFDYPSIGRYWISPRLFEKGFISDEKAAMLYNTTINLEGVTYAVGVISFESTSARRTMAFDKETGLLMIVDMVIFDGAGAETAQTTITYKGSRFVFAPWYGERVEGLSTDTVLSYKTVYITEKEIEEQELAFKVTENNGSWALLEKKHTAASGSTNSIQVISSSSSGDIYVLWIPVGLLSGFSEGEVLFDEDLTSSTVKAMGLSEDPAFGAVRTILFYDRAVQIECTFSMTTGYMVSLHQKPLASGIPEVIYTLVSVK